MPRVTGTIQPVGAAATRISIDGSGFTGTNCNVMDEFMRAAGVDPSVVSELKPEYAMTSERETEGLL